MAEPSWEVGASVVVHSPGNGSFSVEEHGIVVGIGCAYSDPKQPDLMRNDGIMIKLTISNTRGIFAPENVSRPLHSASSNANSTEGTQRRRSSRRARVTPSPNTTVTAPTKIDASNDDSVEVLQSNPRKRPLEGEPATKAQSKMEEGSKAVSDYSGSVEGGDMNPSDVPESEMGDTVPTFRVKAALTARAKCPNCEDQIAKDKLCLQPISKQRGWYHVTCAVELFCVGTSRPTVDQLEGQDRLTSLQRQTLDSLLREVSQDDDEPSAVDAANACAVEDVKFEHDDDEENDPPLVSLKKPSKKRMNGNDKEIGIKTETVSSEPVNRANQKVDTDEDEDDNGALLLADDTDSDDAREFAYRVEYATTGRAACRGCDDRITKGEVRIAEKPMFRGKPGYIVYRHLGCTIFTEQVKGREDVGGWRRLRKFDLQDLEKRIEESKVLVEKENQELEPDELVQAKFEGEIRQPPEGLSANLLPFQVEGTSWMVHQEKHEPMIRGGILADEMGMGKTLQTITTILDNRPKLQHCKPGAKHPPSAGDIEDRKREESLWNESLLQWKIDLEKSNVPKNLICQGIGKKKSVMGSRAGTLVICPVIALYQWRDEIQKFSNDNALSVCCYHGPNRRKEFPAELLIKYDVVLTTYQVVEADFRKMVSPNKVKCPNCGGRFKIDKLRVHLTYFCGDGARRTEAQSLQRRTANRPGRNRGGSDSGRDDNSRKKPPSTKLVGRKSRTKELTKKATTPSPKAISKPLRRVARMNGYDSDSDLSGTEDVEMTAGRPRRIAASSASARMKKYASQEDSADSSDSESFIEAKEGSDSGSETEEQVASHSNDKKRMYMSASSDSDSSDNEALARAKKKQKLAIARASKVKTTQTPDRRKPKKKTFSKGKMKKKPAHTKGKKMHTPEDNSSDTESSDDERNRDPMEGIDLAKLIQEATEGAQVSVLHTLCWWRIVLDEAHMIKSRASQTAAATFSLNAIHRWCLSGTPLQNRVGELYSLIRFLRIDPMAHYFCRHNGCDCKSVHYRMLNGKCQECGHGTIQHFSYFNKHVLNPIQRAGYQGDGRRAMMKLKSEVLDKCLIRRTKESRAEDMNLPPRVVKIRGIRLHPVEEDFYNALYTQTKSSFDDYVGEGTLLNNYAHIFDLLTKMRQAVDHPYLIVYNTKNNGKFATPGAPVVANGTIDCEICHEPPTDRVVSSCCGAAFCRSCVVDFMSPSLENMSSEGLRCPSCRDPFSIDVNQTSSDVVDDSMLTVTEESGSATAAMPSLKEMPHVSSGSILRRINLAEFATSTKIEAVVEELVEMRTQRPGSKALVFSQFVNMLDLLRWRLHSDPFLQDLNLGVRILHGGMNVQSRNEALKDFREDGSVRVLLMSLKAAGVALNLTVANEAYLLDPWWNPAAEMQAIDRTHRLGQYRPIRAVRFIAEGTVEERVLQLQEKKRLVFDGTVGRDAASLKMLTVEDMKALFS